MDIRDLGERFVVRRQIPRSEDPGDSIVEFRHRRHGVVVWHGHLAGGERGGLGVYVEFGTVRRKRCGMRRLPFVEVLQDAETEIVGFVPDAHVEAALAILRPRRRRGSRDDAGAAETTRT